MRLATKDRKNALHKVKTSPTTENIEKYKIIEAKAFSIEELTDAIYKANDTAVGPDDIHYQMLKHLPNETLQTLLGALNDIWYSGNFPNSWHTSTVIAVPKPGTNRTHPTIALSL